MIVQTDFLDHWKTCLLCDLLDDKCAPLYVLRLWAHCQNRKTHIVPNGTPRIIKAICKAPQDPETFHSAMVEAGFIRADGDDIVAHDWDTVNAALIANWENGKRGGRPLKKTHTKPMGSGRVKPSQTDKSREDETRGDKPHDMSTTETVPDPIEPLALTEHGEYGNCDILHKPEQAVDLKLQEHADFMRADVTSIACAICEEKTGPAMGYISKLLKEAAANLESDTKACEIFRETLFEFWSELKAGEEPRCIAAALTARLKSAVGVT